MHTQTRALTHIHARARFGIAPAQRLQNEFLAISQGPEVQREQSRQQRVGVRAVLCRVCEQVVPGLTADQWGVCFAMSVAGGIIAGSTWRLEPTGNIHARTQASARTPDIGQTAVHMVRQSTHTWRQVRACTCAHTYIHSPTHVQVTSYKGGELMCRVPVCVHMCRFCDESMALAASLLPALGLTLLLFRTGKPSNTATISTSASITSLSITSLSITSTNQGIDSFTSR